MRTSSCYALHARHTNEKLQWELDATGHPSELADDCVCVKTQEKDLREKNKQTNKKQRAYLTQVLHTPGMQHFEVWVHKHSLCPCIKQRAGKHRFSRNLGWSKSLAQTDSICYLEQVIYTSYILHSLSVVEKEHENLAYLPTPYLGWGETKTAKTTHFALQFRWHHTSQN